jgi:hypothetical protein
LQIARRNLIPFRAETEGEKQSFQISVSICMLHQTIFTFQDQSENRRKILKMQKETNYLDQSSSCNVAGGICELHAKQCRLQNRWENLNKNKKWRHHLKIFLPSANLILTKACSTIQLSAQSNLVRQYL